ncbi:hypothetical protein [Cerasicoccus maritimus]|uniref:hypothetical protein n=1 Tax=Cerasicoccus maritimus TaxID=490089 RepID=UPI002852BF6D|nr:hypothetical protein [Cerasicoccus maritimus]
MKAEDPWSISKDYATKSSFKKYAKKHPDEYTSCFANLDKIISLLNGGTKLAQLKIGFFRSEKDDLWRIGQTQVQDAHETRLYVSINDVTKIIHILKIGDKSSQAQDIPDCKKIIRSKIKASSTNLSQKDQNKRQ